MGLADCDVIESWEEQGPLSRYDASATGVTFVTDPTFQSGGSLRLESVASRKALSFGGLASGKHLSTYILFEQLPDADIDLFTVARVSGPGPSEVGLAYDTATGCAKPVVRDPTNTHYGPVGATEMLVDTWYLVDWQWADSIGTIQWRLNAAGGDIDAEPDWVYPALSGGGAKGTVILGQNSDNASPAGTYIMCFGPTMVVRGTAGGDHPAYPIGVHGCATLHPTGEGTHNLASDFTDDEANSPPVNPHLRIDDQPTVTNDTDAVYQSGTDPAAYLEYVLENLPADAADPILGAILKFGYDTGGSASGPFFKMDLVLGGVANIIVNNSMIGTFSKAWNQGLVDDPVPEFTVAETNAALLRVSSSGDNDPQPRLRDIWLNVAYFIDPPPPAGAPAERLQTARTTLRWEGSPNRFRRPTWAKR